VLSLRKSTIEPAFYTQIDLTALLGRSLAALARDRAQGLLPYPLRLGKRVVWPRQEIHLWIEAGMPPASEWQHRRNAQSRKQGDSAAL
jgi:predicted DNA-binding transcriptional regulator AlpA